MPGDPDGWALGGPDGATVGWGGFAEYRFRTDRPSLQVDIDDIALLDAVQAFMLSALPIALPIFGLEPFHGSAVRGEDGAMMFLGGRGDGKSSTASALHSMGYAVLTDDACALDADGRIWPGPPLVSPRDERAEQRAVGQYNRKLLRSVGEVEGSPMTVLRTFVLRPLSGSDLVIRRMNPAEAFPAVIAQSRQPTFLAEVRRELQFRLAARLSTLGVYEVRYDPSRSSFLDLAAEVVRSPGLRAS